MAMATGIAGTVRAPPVIQNLLINYKLFCYKVYSELIFVSIS